MLMSHIGLISCASKKHPGISEAKDLYDSSLFLKSRKYIERKCDRWYILSAKYGLVEPTTKIEMYDETLNNKTRNERYEWATSVWKDLCERIKPEDKITILAGEKYREHLVPFLSKFGCKVNVPMKGLSIGRQLQWLSDQLRLPNRNRDIEIFYKALKKLESGVGGKRLISQCTGNQIWPKKGVYFFFEPGEIRTRVGEGLRIVRVGTHGVSSGSKATLWNRLRTHRGTIDGNGNHRSSIFRLHVGAAISIRDSSYQVSSWGIGQTSDSRIREAEKILEQKVSSHIGNMCVLWLAIDDESSPASDRAYIERNIIGLLIGIDGPINPPSRNWLGCFSPDERIRNSGLWNLDFLNYPYSSDCMDIFNEYVNITIGKTPAPHESIAPSGWYELEKTSIARNQLTLFEDKNC